MNKKILAIIGGVIALLGMTIVLILVFKSEGIVVFSGIRSNYSSNVSNNTWTSTASKIKGSLRVDITFDSANLKALHANASNTEGKVVFKLIQDKVEKSVDITGQFNDNIDMSEFKPGKIRMILEFDSADGVKTVISW